MKGQENVCIWTNIYIYEYNKVNMELKRHIFIIICAHNLGGARGVIVIVEGNGDGDTSSNPGHFT